MKIKGIHIAVLTAAYIALQNESCIEEYDPVLNESDTVSILVVDGNITDQTGPFTVKLSRSVPVGSPYGPESVIGAEVSIFDDAGNLFQLYGDSMGVYKTENENLRGIPGTTYTLNITTDDGMHYESTPVLMRVVPNIDSIYFIQKKRYVFYNNQSIDQNYLDICIDTKKGTGETDYWRWEYEETWEIHLPTDVKIYGTLHFVTVEKPEEDKICWITNSSRSLILQSSDIFSGEDADGIRIMSIYPTDDRLSVKYSILVTQYAMDKELYQYLKKLDEANNGTGGLYSIRPTGVFGNVTCCETNKKVLGYFSASIKKSKRLFINKSEHDLEYNDPYKQCMYGYSDAGFNGDVFFGYTYDSLKILCNSEYCQTCRARGTNKRPWFW